MKQKALALEGYRILEFTHAIMGPVAGLILAEMGAEIIRIEPSPDGDPTRELKGFGAGYYSFYNRQKKSFALNLKTPEGKEIVAKLLMTSDALIENFAPNTMQRLGLGYETVHEHNPRLIYCSLKGFQPGPYENRQALDEVVQMMSGLAYMTGPPGQPLRAGASVVDIMGGLFGAYAIVTAFLEREKTGEGKFLQTGLYETAAFIMGQHMAYSAMSQSPIPPMAARTPAWSVYRIFETKDKKQIFIGITSDKHWQRFCAVFNRLDLFENPQYATNNQRLDARAILYPELEAFFATLVSSDVLNKAEQANIPFAPIAVPEDLFDDVHLNQSGVLLETILPNGLVTKLPRIPVYEGKEKMRRLKDAPRVGEDSFELLRELNYSEAELQALHHKRVINGDQ